MPEFSKNSLSVVEHTPRNSFPLLYRRAVRVQQGIGDRERMIGGKGVVLNLVHCSCGWRKMRGEWLLQCF